jgi:copper chaperone CopZ
MKKVFLLMATVVLFSACQTGSRSSSDMTVQDVQVDPENIEFVQISVEGMTCTGCESTVEKGLLSLDGVMEADASHTEKTAIVKFDKTRTSIDEMMLKIEERGYEPLGYETREVL